VHFDDCQNSQSAHHDRQTNVQDGQSGEGESTFATTASITVMYYNMVQRVWNEKENRVSKRLWSRFSHDLRDIMEPSFQRTIDSRRVEDLRRRRGDIATGIGILCDRTVGSCGGLDPIWFSVSRHGCY
jgi:hypothetical protein